MMMIDDDWNPIDRKADMDTDKKNNYMIKKVEQ